MKIQFDNRLISSFLLFLDHEIQDKGQGYYNFSSRLYPVRSQYSNLYAYAAPFKQLINDTSITGATVMTGVYVNGNYINVGQSGLYSINHNQGTVYFTSSLSNSTVVSGNYSIKDINMNITDEEEYKVLFETKYQFLSKFSQNFSGILPDVKTLPAIFLKYKGGDAIPAIFGGAKDNKIDIRAVILAENEFQKIATCNILKNLTYRNVPIVSSTPFDYLGNYTGLEYNYNNLNFDTGYTPLIMDVKVKDIPLTTVGEMENIGSRNAFVDFSISTFMR